MEDVVVLEEAGFNDDDDDNDDDLEPRWEEVERDLPNISSSGMDEYASLAA